MRSKKPKREPTRRSSRLQRGTANNTSVNVDCAVATTNEIIDETAAITAEASAQNSPLQDGSEDVTKNGSPHAGESQEEIPSTEPPKEKECIDDFGPFQIMRVYPVSGNLEECELNRLNSQQKDTVAGDASSFKVNENDSGRGTTKRRIVIKSVWNVSKDGDGETAGQSQHNR